MISTLTRMFASDGPRQNGAKALWAASLVAGLHLVAIVALLWAGNDFWPWHVLMVLVFACGATILSWKDVREHRLPDDIVLPLTVVLVLIAIVGAALLGQWGTLARMLVAGGGLFLVFLAIAMLPGGMLGGGDVKLAFSVGAVAAISGWNAVGIAVIAGFLAAGVTATLMMMLGRGNRHSRIAFGPFLCAGVPIASLVLQ